MNNEVAKVYESRRNYADNIFHQKLRAFMRKYNIEINQLNEIGVISWIDVIQEARHDMIKWNDMWRDEVRSKNV